MNKITTTIGSLCILLLLVVNVSALDFCKSGEVGEDLEIKSIEINNRDGNDDEWTLLDEIEIEVEIENDGSENIEEVIVELGFFDEDDDNLANELDFLSRDDEEIDLGKVKNNDEETAIFRFRLPADISDGDYELRIKVYSEDIGEENLCVESSDDFSDDNYEKIEVKQEEDEGKFIVFDDVMLIPEAPLCGETVTLRADLVNIGDEDQARVKVNIRSDEMGIDYSEEFGDEIEEGDREEISFTFKIPQDADNQEYILELTAEYDYKNGIYRQISDTIKRIPIQVLTCFSEQEELPPLITGRVVQQPSPFEDINEEEVQEDSIVKQFSENSFLLVMGIVTVFLAIITIILIIVVVSRS